MIKNFTIFGERCSGTNFLELAMLANFNVPVTWNYGWKHFFGHSKYENTSETLFIGIVRDPYDWVKSLHRTPWHLNKRLKQGKRHFLYAPFWSTRKPNDSHPERYEIAADRHIYEKRRYHNIFECRATKLKYLIETAPTKVDNYILIKYEDLKSNYEKTLSKIGDDFNLTKRNEVHFPKEIKKYKKTNRPFVVNRQPSPFTKADIYDNKLLQRKYEIELGYLEP